MQMCPKTIGVFLFVCFLNLSDGKKIVFSCIVDIIIIFKK